MWLRCILLLILYSYNVKGVVKIASVEEDVEFQWLRTLSVRTTRRGDVVRDDRRH